MEALRGRPLASFRRRAAALVMDLAIVVMIYFAVLIAAGAGANLAEKPERDGRLEQNIVHYLVSGGVAVEPAQQELVIAIDPERAIPLLLLFLAYFTLTTLISQGQTAGKRLMGIRVVSLTGTRISLWQAFERTLGYGASCLELGFGFMQYFIHPNRLTVHDRIAETMVVDDR